MVTVTVTRITVRVTRVMLAVAGPQLRHSGWK